ncbi:hypothetical protein [Pseudonocardia sp.]|jgi:hypothetical protein|uniref:hypothetical protein n=1 Tax=Pseudonocardia sp. TaxID=60912 RepID=UPI0031FD370A
MRGVRGHGSVRRTAAALVTTGVAAAVLAGCGDAGAELTPGPAPQSSSTSPTPSPETTTSAAPTTTVPAPTTRAHGTTAPHPVTPSRTAGAQAAAPAMIWPVTDAAAARQLQADVDGGSQPWLLDPQEVALSYASSVYGWASPETTPAGDGTVQVQDAQGGRATVHLVQPVRAGAGGIWVVGAAERT